MSICVYHQPWEIPAVTPSPVTHLAETDSPEAKSVGPYAMVVDLAETPLAVDGLEISPQVVDLPKSSSSPASSQAEVQTGAKGSPPLTQAAETAEITITETTA